jgi:hypothetical protein
VVKNLTKRASSREDYFPKTLFTLSRCRIAEDDGFRDLLSRSQMHIDERNEVVLAAQQRIRRRHRCVGGSWFGVATSVAATCIYREDPPRVTASRNRLGISLSKRIRHGLVAKLNGKRRPWTYEALYRILADYSCARRAPAPIASSQHARPGSARRASERAYFSISLLLHTIASA